MTEPEWIPCCEHCGCTDSSEGHDDTCRYGCNEQPADHISIFDGPPAPTHEFKRKWSGDQGDECWQSKGMDGLDIIRCGRRRLDPIHVAGAAEVTDRWAQQ